ncbi:MAG: PaaI family thioesterase [Actinobacteria bacterium]|nr:PaaI family thioesterase [Actinomycetota bacterium]
MASETRIWEASSKDEEEKYKAILKDRVENSPYYQLLGLKIVGLGSGWAEFELEAGEKLWNAGGTVHGGATASIADAAAGVALSTLIDYSNEKPVSVELKINFCSAVKDGTMRARGEIIKRGAKINVCETRVHIKDRLVAVMVSTLMVVPRAPVQEVRT